MCSGSIISARRDIKHNITCPVYTLCSYRAPKTARKQVSNLQQERDAVTFIFISASTFVQIVWSLAGFSSENTRKAKKCADKTLDLSHVTQNTVPSDSQRWNLQKQRHIPTAGWALEAFGLNLHQMCRATCAINEIARDLGCRYLNESFLFDSRCLLRWRRHSSLANIHTLLPVEIWELCSI